MAIVKTVYHHLGTWETKAQLGGFVEFIQSSTSPTVPVTEQVEAPKLLALCWATARDPEPAW